jgi:hypothetical protein
MTIREHFGSSLCSFWLMRDERCSNPTAGHHQTFKEFGLTNLTPLRRPAENTNQEFFTQAQREPYDRCSRNSG